MFLEFSVAGFTRFSIPLCSTKKASQSRCLFLWSMAPAAPSAAPARRAPRFCPLSCPVQCSSIASSTFLSIFVPQAEHPSPPERGSVPASGPSGSRRCRRGVAHRHQRQRDADGRAEDRDDGGIAHRDGISHGNTTGETSI